MSERFTNTSRNIFSGISFKILNIALPFLLRTVMLYYMGTEYTGLSSLFASILRVLSLAELGLQNVIVYCLYKPIADNDNDKICGILSYYRKLYKRIGLIILGGGLLLTPFITLLINGSWPEDINIYLIYIIYLVNTSISYMMFAYKGTLLNAHQRMDIVNLIRLFVFAAQYIVQILVLIVFQNYYVYIIFTPLATIILNLIQAFITDRKYPQYNRRNEIDTETIQSIKKGIRGTILEHITDATRNSLDSIVLSAFLGLTVVTVYNNYFYVINSVYAVMLSVSQGMAASIGDSIATESIEHNYSNLNKFTFIYSVIVSVFTCCMICLYQDFMEMWTGKDLMLPISNVIVFCLYFYIMNLPAIRNLYFWGTGLWWAAKHTFVLESLFNIILNIIFVLMIGIPGVSIASILSIIVFNFIMRTNILFKQYFRMSPWSFYKYQILYFISTVCCCAISFLLCNTIMIENLLLCMLIKGGVVIVFSTVFFMLIYHRFRYYDDARVYFYRYLGRYIKNRNV